MVRWVVGQPTRQCAVLEVVPVNVNEELVHLLIGPEAANRSGDLEGAVRQGSVQSVDNDTTKSPSEIVMVNDNSSQGMAYDPISTLPHSRQINKSNLKKPLFSSQKSHKDCNKKKVLF